jgi:hypothetical protein
MAAGIMDESGRRGLPLFGGFEDLLVHRDGAKR